jgi:hypothetical protein
MTRPTCPAEDQLLRGIDGDPGAADLQGHLDGCPRCREHLAYLKTAAGVLRQFAAEAPPLNGFVHDSAGTRGASPADPVETIPVDSRPSGGGEVMGSAGSEPLPAAIDKYPVVEKLGQGGQAVVYRGIHPGLRVDVTIKVGLRPLAADRVDPDALEREGKALAKLDHPNLVRVHDMDVDAAGRLFLVMDYVPGCNLRQHAEQNRPDPRRAATLVAAVARGAAAAHRKNLTHLDIKPENILIDEAGRPRLIDFGLARLRNAWAEESSPSGGTLAFIAPEQARGEAVGNHGDIFALGGVLYFLLTGKAPFEGRDRVEMLDRARRCDFDRSALRAARVPRGLERICLRAMAAEAAGRYASADDLDKDLERFARLPRRLFGVAAAALPLAVLGAWWALGPASIPTPPLKISAMQVDLYRREPPEHLGIIGNTAFAARYDDDARVQAQLSVPAYCYLIALNPDGREQLCSPADESTPPVPSAEIAYPPDPSEGFSLTDGVGLQAFVLVASRQPLPAYGQWRARFGGLPWKSIAVSQGWRFDGRRFESLQQDNERGQPRRLSMPQPFAAACLMLQARPSIESIHAVSFHVRPAPAGAVHP